MGRDLRAAVSNCDQDGSWDLEMRLLLRMVGLQGEGRGRGIWEPESLNRKSSQVLHCVVKVLSESSPVHLKGGSWTSSVCIIWELARNANSWASAQSH